MTVTPDSPFKAAPRISESKFVQVLESVGSFDADALWGSVQRDVRPNTAMTIYRHIVDHGHDPAVWLAIAGKEHTFGTNQSSVLWRNSTHSWTNARTIRRPKTPHTIIIDSVRKSQYVRYGDVIYSILDGLYRVDEPGFAYRNANAVSIVDHIRIFAPGSDNNKPEQYAQTMCDWINEWIATDTGQIPKPEPQPEEPPVSVPISGLKDIRHRLQTATDGNRGPLRTIPMSRKRGVVIHYRGVVTTPAPGYDSFAADATYHVGKDWGQGSRGDGIMYHIGIGWDGKAYWMRDFNRVLWHCGVTKYNEEALAIQLPMGGNQRATPEMLATLERVVDEWRAATGTPRSEVWGHREMPGQSTACPGTLIADFVQPYRAASDDTNQPPDALYIAGNPFGDVPVIAGFKALFLETGRAKYPDDPIAGGLSIFGYPEGPEYGTDDGSAQVFERIIMRYHKGAPSPWDIVATLRHEDIPEAA